MSGEGHKPSEEEMKNNEGFPTIIPTESNESDSQTSSAARMSIDELLLAKGNEDRARIKGDIPDDFELGSSDKTALVERVAGLDNETLKRIDSFFKPFAYDPTRSTAWQIKARGGENPQWIIDLMNIVQSEEIRRGLIGVAP